MAIKSRRTIQNEDGTRSIVWFGSRGSKPENKECIFENDNLTLCLKRRTDITDAETYTDSQSNTIVRSTDDTAILSHIDEYNVLAETGTWLFDISTDTCMFTVYDDRSIRFYAISTSSGSRKYRLAYSGTISIGSASNTREIVLSNGDKLIVQFTSDAFIFNEGQLKTFLPKIYNVLENVQSTMQCSVKNATLKYDWYNQSDRYKINYATQCVQLLDTRNFTLTHDIGNWWIATCITNASDSGRMAFVGEAQFVDKHGNDISIDSETRPVRSSYDDDTSYRQALKDYMMKLSEIRSEKHNNYCEDADAVREFLTQHLSLLKGELWYDVMNGLSLSNVKATKGMIDADVLDIIYSCKYVQYINYFSSTVKKHTYSATFRVQTYFGEIAITI